MRRPILISLLAFTSTSCLTLDPGAEVIDVVEKAPNDCKKLGIVNVNWSVWGTSEESLNAMRNQTLALGGNTLALAGDNIGFAYNCLQKD